jgi:hypothetical protein
MVMPANAAFTPYLYHCGFWSAGRINCRGHRDNLFTRCSRSVAPVAAVPRSSSRSSSLGPHFNIVRPPGVRHRAPAVGGESLPRLSRATTGRGDAEAVEHVHTLHPKPPAPEIFLSDAQLVIARGYGFASWAQLKRKIDSLTKSPAELLVTAVDMADVDQVRRLFQSHADLISRINEPMFGRKSPLVHVARTNLET